MSINEQMIPEYHQVSFLDHPELIGSAYLTIDIGPEKIAEKLSLVPERSFDPDFDYFDFLAVQVGRKIIAFRKHLGNPKPYSYVSCINMDTQDLHSLIESLLPELDYQFFETEDPW